MKTETENTLYPLLCDLDVSQRPAPWERPLSQGPGVKMLQPLWKGSYGKYQMSNGDATADFDGHPIAYIPEIEDLTSIREMDSAGKWLDNPIPDAIDYDEGFQTLELDSSPMINSIPWPEAFEDHLHALPSNALCEQLRQQISEQSNDPPSPRRSGRRSQLQHRHISTPHEPFEPLPAHDISYPSPQGSPMPPGPSKMKNTNPPSTTGPRPQRDYIQFSGAGKDYGPFLCTGILHNLPPQSGIPGWQRVSMMKYCVASSTSSSTSTSPSSSPSSTVFSGSTVSSASSAASSVSSTTNPFTYTGDDHDTGADQQFVLDEQCWCYEGVALPGGKIILGRWWHPLEEGDEYCSMGPFIFWNVPS